MFPDIKRQINELLSNLEDDDFHEIHIDFVKHLGSRSTVLAEFDNHVDLLRKAFLDRIYSVTETVLQRGSHGGVKSESSPRTAGLDDIAAAAGADDFDPAIHTSDDSAITQCPSLTFDSPDEAATLALAWPSSDSSSGSEYQAEEFKLERRQTRRPKRLTLTLALQPDRIQDVRNIWTLCQCLRGKGPLIESEGTTPENDLTRLRRCLEFTEDTVRKSKSAVHTLSLRIYAVQLAIAYQDYKRAADSQNTAHSLNQGTRRRKRKPLVNSKRRHARKCQRDTSLDWMTAQLYDDIDISNLAATDGRRASVRYWLRIGEPLVSLYNYCPALLIAPGMQITQEDLMGMKQDERQGFSDSILAAYTPFSDDLAALNFVMCPLLQCINGVPTLRVEQLTEEQLSHIEEPSLQYWTRFIDCPATDVAWPSMG